MNDTTWQEAYVANLHTMITALDEHVTKEDAVRILLEQVTELLPGTTLDGATNEPAPYVAIASAGEFAAMWNTREPEVREKMWEAIRGAADEGYKCFMEDHAGLKEQLTHMLNAQALTPAGMNQREAFKDTLEMAWERGMHYADRLTPSTTYQHLVEMYTKVTLNPSMSASKLGRWLGWAQAAVVASGVASLEDMKAINKKHADGQNVSWTIEYAHPDCQFCEGAAEEAISHATETGADGATAYGIAMDGSANLTDHAATVRRA